MELYRRRLGWRDGLAALCFHGQRADVAEMFNLTSVFQVSKIYRETRFAEAKLIFGYILGGYLGHLAQYGEGHYLLTEKGSRVQNRELGPRALTPRDAWVLDPSDPRRLAK